MIEKACFVPFIIKNDKFDSILSFITKKIAENSSKTKYYLLATSSISLGNHVVVKKVRNSIFEVLTSIIGSIKKCDIIFTGIDDSKLFLIYVISKFFKKKKIVVRIGGSYEVRTSLLDRPPSFKDKILTNFVVPLNLKIADKLIFVSNYVKDDYSKRFNIGKKGIVIYNGTEENKEKPNEKIVQKKRHFKGVVVFNGRFARQKRPEIFFELSKQMSDVLFVLITANFKNRIEIGKNMMIFNEISQKEVNSVLASSDVFLMPSLMEGCSNAVLEAIASGVPVIAANSGSLPELCGFGKRGILVDVNKDEIKNYKKAVYFALNNKNKSKEFSEHEKAFAHELNWKYVAKKYEEAFEF